MKEICIYLEEENGSLLQYSCPDNPMDRGARWAIVYGVAKRRTRWSTGTHVYAHTHTHTHASLHIIGAALLAIAPSLKQHILVPVAV